MVRENSTDQTSREKVDTSKWHLYPLLRFFNSRAFLKILHIWRRHLAFILYGTPKHNHSASFYEESSSCFCFHGIEIMPQVKGHHYSGFCTKLRVTH